MGTVAAEARLLLVPQAVLFILGALLDLAGARRPLAKTLPKAEHPVGGA